MSERTCRQNTSYDPATRILLSQRGERWGRPSRIQQLYVGIALTRQDEPPLVKNRAVFRSLLETLLARNPTERLLLENEAEVLIR